MTDAIAMAGAIVNLSPEDFKSSCRTITVDGIFYLSLEDAMAKIRACHPWACHNKEALRAKKEAESAKTQALQGKKKAARQSSFLRALQWKRKSSRERYGPPSARQLQGSFEV